MQLRRRFSHIWRNVIRREQVNRDLDDEITEAFEQLVEEHVQGGVPRDEARRRATLEMGRVEIIKEDVRDARAGAWVDTCLQDLRYALRGLRRSPLFAVAGVFSIAIGIAGTAAIFSLADTLLFRHRPGIADPSRLVDVGRKDIDGDFGALSYPDYLDYRTLATTLQGLAAWDGETFGLVSPQGAIRADGALVSANYFDVLGVPITLGRGFVSDDERNGTEPVAIISERLWRTHFGGNPDVVGQTVQLSGHAFVVVGVAGASFSGTTVALEDVWTPLTTFHDSAQLARRDATGLHSIGRLQPGVSLERARTELDRIASDLSREHAEDRGMGAMVLPAHQIPVSERGAVDTFIGALFGMVGLVLAIACMNVGGMLLARGTGRSREVALRLALGASRSRIVRLLLTESLVLALAGALVGLGGALVLTRVLRAVVPVLPLPVSLDFGIDWRVMVFAIVTSAFAVLLSGLLPALQTVRVHPQGAARPSAPGAIQGHHRLRQIFVVAQVALSITLIVCALVLARSLTAAASIDTGFTTEQIDLVGLDLQLGGYDAASGPGFIEQLISRVQRLPRVEAVASTWLVPLQLRGTAVRMWRPDQPAIETPAATPDWTIVSSQYFDVVHMPIVGGRAFAITDRQGAPAVGIINQSLAGRLFPDGDPIGRLILYGEDRRPMQIVGVARDAKYRSLGERARPFLYIPFAQRYQQELSLLIRHSGPTTVVPEVRALIRGLDARLPLLQVTTLADATAFSLFPQRLATWMAGSVGLIGIVLASLGLSTLTAYNVYRRTREIGLRIAVGATPASVLRLIVRQAMLLTGVGAVIGLLLASVATPLLRSLLYGVTPLDPLSFAIGGALFGSLALVCSVLPAGRAASMNPVEALRTE